MYVGDWGVKLARPMGETQYTYVNTAKTLQLATVGGNINVIQAPTTNAECVETEGGEPCPTYVTTIGNYDYFVRMDGGVTEADRATMFDPASYSSIYETEAENTETTE